MASKCRVIEGGLCEFTQGCNSNHIAFDLVNQGYTLGKIVAHSDGVVVSVRNNCNKTYSNSNSAIAEWGDSYGNYVLIRHNKLYTMYAHLSYGSVCVSPNQKVKAGQKIGYMGNTGHSNGGHLHFEVRTGESWTTRIDPTPYFNTDLSISIISKVDRDKNKKQLEILLDDNMRVRTEPVINDNNILGIINKGFYNILDTISKNDYTWVKIADNQYVALIDGYSVIRDIEKENIELDENKEIEENEDKIKEYELKIKELEKKIQEKEDKINILNKELNSFTIFNFDSDGDYYFKQMKKDSCIKFKIMQ